MFLFFENGPFGHKGILDPLWDVPEALSMQDNLLVPVGPDKLSEYFAAVVKRTDVSV